MAKGKAYEVMIQIGGKAAGSLDKAFSKAKKELNNLYSFSKRTNQGFLSTVDKFDSFADKTFSVMAKGAAAASAGLAGGLASATIAGSNFEAQMSAVQSISQASAGDMERLKSLAKQMGIETKFSATEAGKGLEYMAMAGWDVDSMLSGLPGIMNLAAASGEDLGQVSDIVTDAMTAFGLEASRSAEFADVLAQASAKSNTDVAMMGETFQYVAPVAGSLGFTIQDTATAIGTLANSGIKGSQAGTTLRSIMSRLVKPTKEVQAAMDQIGLSVTDANGTMRSLDDILGDLRQGFSGLSEAEQGSVAASLAGHEAMSGMLILARSGEEDYNKLSEAINNSKGAAKEMSEVKMDNLKGDATILKSSLEGAGIAIYEGLNRPFREAVQTGTEWVNSFTENIEEDLPKIRRAVKGAGDWLMGFIRPVLHLGQWFLKNPDVIQGGLAGLISTLLTFKAVKGISAAVKLFGTLSGLVGAWPVAAVGLAVGGIVGITTAMKAAARERAAKNLAEHFGDVTLSVEELGEAARHIIGDDLFENIEAMDKSGEKAKEFYESMLDSIKEIKKTDWKLSMGIKLEDSDVQGYVSAVDSYVKNAQDYISESGYELNMAVNVLLGDSGKEIAEDSGEFYQALSARLEPLKQNISEVLQDITEHGLTLDKQKLVNDYLKQMEEVTSMITEAQNTSKLQVIQSKYAGVKLDSDSFLNLQSEINSQTEEALEGLDHSFEVSLTALNAQKSAWESGETDANGNRLGLSPEQYDARFEQLVQGYYQDKAATIQKGQQFLVDSVMATYGDEIEPAWEAINQRLEEILPDIMNNPNTDPRQYAQDLRYAMLEAVKEADLPKDTQDALEMLLEGLKPSEEQMDILIQQMEQSEQKVPQAFMRGIDSVNVVKAVTGDWEGLQVTAGKILSKSPEQSVFIEAARQQGAEIPEVIAREIEEKYPEIENATKGILETMKESFGAGVNADVPITLNLQTVMTTTEGRETIEKVKGSSQSLVVQAARQHLPGHADGGIFDTPHVAMFAEAGPEAVVPLDGSREALSIWQEAGRILGAYEKNSYSRIYESISGGQEENGGTIGGGYGIGAFQPVIHIYGSTSREDVHSELEMTFEKWVEYMERFQNTQRRVSF